MSTFTLRLDESARTVLLNTIELVKQSAQAEIIKGNLTDEILQQHEELLQLHRGILYIAPDPEEVLESEESETVAEDSPELDTPSY